MSVTVRTPGRLHFGLFCPGEPVRPGRRFGGAGLMVERPAIHVEIADAPAWSAEGPSADRALTFARQAALYRVYVVFPAEGAGRWDREGRQFMDVFLPELNRCLFPDSLP